MHRILNAVGFQCAWWALIAGADHGLDLYACVFAAALALAHLCWSEHRLNEWRLASTVMLLGIALDSVLQALGVLRFEGWAVGSLSPVWLWMLWLLFGMTLNSSLSFLKDKPLILSAALGAVLGPANYIAGAQLGAAALESTPGHLAALGLTWMFALPAMVFLAQRSLPHPGPQTT